MRYFALVALAVSAAASTAQPKTCPSPDAIQSQLKQHLEQLHPLLLSIPANLKISYRNLNSPINGHAHLSGDYDAQIEIIGNQCPGNLTLDALSVLLCHEIGHLAGGAPFMNFAGVNSSLRFSAEGQADFFATSSCLPSLWKKENNSVSLAQISANPGLEKICSPSMGEQERALCARIAIASKTLQNYYYALALIETNNITPPRSPGPEPSFETQDTSITRQTLTREYPKLQCRLDTMLAGIKCQSEMYTNFSVNPDATLACGEYAILASRPACWFKVD